MTLCWGFSSYFITWLFLIFHILHIIRAMVILPRWVFYVFICKYFWVIVMFVILMSVTFLFLAWMPMWMTVAMITVINFNCFLYGVEAFFQLFILMKITCFLCLVHHLVVICSAFQDAEKILNKKLGKMFQLTSMWCLSNYLFIADYYNI